jgi:sugar lactone lactonase YvrE
LIPKPVIALAVFLLLLADESFAGACETGIATGVAPPVVTRLRSYAWTFHAPTRMALAGDFSLYVTDPERHRVVARDAAGRIVDSRRLDGRPVSIAVDAEGRIYVGDGDLGRVRVYSRNWDSLYDLGIGAGEFEFPAAIAVAPGGRTYVVDSQAHRVRVFLAGGSDDFSFGGPGGGGGLFNFPAGIFVDGTAGEVFVVDQLNFQVQVFDLQGTYLRCIGGTGASPGFFGNKKRPLNQPQGVWVDGAGRVLVSDAADGRIKVFDRNGNGLATIGEFGAQVGGLRVPTDLVVDAGNRLFVASANNARLEVFGLDDYQDPEAVAPGVLRVEPEVLDRDAPLGEVEIALELPDYRIDAILAETLTLNGLAPRSTEFGDTDRDLQPELVAYFDAAVLLQTLPHKGEGRLAAAALLDNGFAVEAEAPIEVLSRVTDADGDGVDDAFDLCPDSGAGTPTDADGCSLAQLCPCAGRGDEAWRNRGHYLVCVIRGALRIGRHNQLAPAELRGLLPAAAKSACGGRGQRHTRWKRRHR